jgi:putative acetyltransferase
MTFVIADETPSDFPAVEAVHRAAFGGEYEAAVVARLRATGYVAASVLARRAGEVVGHILFSRLDATLDGRPLDAVALAPLAVRPGAQAGGIGTRLVIAGLARMRGQGRAAAFVRGHPWFYPRFGFSAAAIAHLDTPWRDAAYMGLALRPGALAGQGGCVRYPAAFTPV